MENQRASEVPGGGPYANPAGFENQVSKIRGRRTSQKDIPEDIEARPRNRVSLTAPKRGDGLKRRPSRRHRPPGGGRNRVPLPARAGKAQEPAGVGALA